MFKNTLLLLVLTWPGVCFSQEIQSPDANKIDTTDLVWNKWDTDNFIILSLDKNEGYKIYRQVEKIKKESLSRWGLEDYNLKEKCKIVCVFDKKYLKNFFRLDDSYVEVLKENGEVVSSSIWLDKKDILNDEIFYVLILQSDLKWWVKRGLYFLKNDVDFVKNNIQEDLEDFSNIINISEDDWKKLSLEDKNKFDKTASIFCLFLRKEFGQNNFLKIINSNQSESDFEKIIGFKNYEQINDIFKRYKNYLYKDKINNKIPDDYLKIKGVE
jgi:hypothetical protein